MTSQAWITDLLGRHFFQYLVFLHNVLQVLSGFDVSLSHSLMAYNRIDQQNSHFNELMRPSRLIDETIVDRC